MALKDEEVDRQIQQMAAFILEEARDKAKEITIKADDDFQRELAKNVQEQRQKLLAEHEKRKKNWETKKRIAYSHELNQSRLKLLEARAAVVKEVTDETRSKLDSLTKGGEYKNTLRSLIAQGLLTLMENKIFVQCRKEDESIVKSVIPDAVADYKKKMHIDVSVELDSTYLPSGPSKVESGAEFCSGGILLKAAAGRITCDNTLDARLRIACEQTQPEIRTTLFGASVTRKHKD